jgi:hypothetical protein
MACHQAGPADFDSRQEELLKQSGAEPILATPSVDAFEITVPIFLPVDAALREAALLTNGAHWYSASMPVGGHTVFVTGSRQAYEIPGGLEAYATTENGVFSRTDGIASLTFSAHGLSFWMTVECERPDADPRCVDEFYIRSLAHGLVRHE